jgi:uncharacterized protein (TIGR02246 family)
MNRRFLLAILFIALLTPFAVNAQQSAAAEVQKLERAWLDAYEKLDQKAMDQIVADDFLITFPNGAMQTKAQILASLKPPASTPQTSSKFHTEDVQARVYGDTVILTGRVISEWWRDGKIAGKEISRYTDTYVKRNGRWQVVASHLSNAASPGEKRNHHAKTR